MKAILSCTPDDAYSFSLPFAVYSWYLCGINSMVFIPDTPYDLSNAEVLRFGYAMGTTERICPTVRFERFEAPPHKQATYAQCARLYAAADRDIKEDILITTDVDMCVFNGDYWGEFDYDAAINIIGADLTPPGQYPICYISAPVVAWRNFMQINRRPLQKCLDDLLGNIEAENFRGNYWAKDQETVHTQLQSYYALVMEHLRAKPGTQFATRRADRDGWNITKDIIDAHLPRPGYTEENFAKIFALFETMYPDHDHAWMLEYRKTFMSLM